jgi:hypothetical protein
MRKTLLIATALTASAHAFSSVAAQPSSSVLQSLPTDVQKDIEETRARCQQAAGNVPSGDVGLVTFTVSGKQAVLVDPKLLCDGCYKGYNCTNRGTRDVRVYVLFRDAWKKFLSDEAITGDIFVSYVPGKYRPEGQKLNALVVDLFIGNKECPTRRAGSMSEQSWEARSCVVRWNGTKFTYKPL